MSEYGWLVTTRNHRFEVVEEEGGPNFVARFRNYTSALNAAELANKVLAYVDIDTAKRVVANDPECLWDMDPKVN